MKKKQKIPFIDKLFLCINIGLCLALLLSYLSPITDPKKAWLIAFFGLAYPPLLLCNAIMIVYWLLRRSRFVLLPVITILCGFSVLKSNIGLHLPSNEIKNPEDIRVLTYNVHDFKRYDNQYLDSSDAHNTLDIITAQQPDILCIQEYYTRHKGKYAMTDTLKKLLNTKHGYFKIFYGTEQDGIGMAIFSKYPIKATGFIQLTQLNNGNQCLYTDVERNGRLFRVYTVHLQSIKFNPTDYRYLDTAKKGKPSLALTKRLGVKLKRAFIKRAEQVAKVKEHAAQCPYPYIITGDFNDTPTSYAVNQMAKGIQNAFYEKGSGLGRTYNGDFPNYQIDFVMATNDFDVTGYRIIEKKISDHYPVCVDLRLQ